MNLRSLSLACLITTLPALAFANAKGVGLGVAGGLAYSKDKLGDSKDAIGTRFAWGFFVDIPLLDTFFITPATMLYQVDHGGTKTPVTDVDLNFKFIVPAGSIHFGAGLTAGLSTGIEANHYVPHWGALGIVSFNLVANLDAFVMAQFKRLAPEKSSNIDDIHAYAGGMFYF